MPPVVTNSLDFSTLPCVDVGSAFFTLPKELDVKLQRYPATHDRASGALHFSARVSNLERRDDGTDVKLREAYLRAALGEFVSMEESVKIDAPTMTGVQIVNSKNPLLHLLKQLRNMQFHLQAATLISQQQPCTYVNREIEITIWHIGDLKNADFYRLRDARHYDPDDVTQMLDWFNESQRVWGTNDLLKRGVEIYAASIAT